jgi:diguanylate cyclase (GGDEF)-like protein/PAS domain S-box-containing protein
MNGFAWLNNLKIWVRLVILILAGTICFGAGLIYWGALQQKKVAVEQAKDFAESVKQMTMAGLTGMMITGQVAQRNIFLDQIRDSNHIESLKVFRGRPVVLQFGEGHAGELPSTAAEHLVLDTGESYYEVFSAPDGSEMLRVILPAIALRNYLGKNCLDCHQVAPGTVLGAVSMEISLVRANQTARVFAVSAFGVAAVLCVPLVLFIWYFISHWMTRPLRRMTSGLIRIAEGDLDSASHLQSGGKDEIGMATEAFNRVMDKAKELLAEQRMSRIVFENSLEGIVVTDAASRIQLVNRAFAETTGYSAEDVIGLTPAILKSGKQDDAFYREFWRVLNKTGEWRGEIWNRRKNGSIYAEKLSISAVRSRLGEVEHYVAIFSDITERKKRDELISFQAFHDSLTGLPNRMLFLDRLDLTLAQARRSKSGKVAVMFMDLDHFKEINDTFGHDAGDACLIEAAHRLRQCVRASDTVARMGGDEFTLLLPEVTEENDVRVVGQKILEAMKSPIILDGHEVSISTSIGISMYPHDAEDGETLLKRADAAMYQVKKSGRAGMFFFAPNLTGSPSRPSV